MERVNGKWGGTQIPLCSLVGTYFCLPCYVCQFVRVVKKSKLEGTLHRPSFETGKNEGIGFESMDMNRDGVI